MPYMHCCNRSVCPVCKPDFLKYDLFSVMVHCSAPVTEDNVTLWSPQAMSQNLAIMYWLITVEPT